MQTDSLPSVAKKMLARNLLDKATAHEVLAAATREKRSFYLQAIEQGAVPADAACLLAAEEFGLPYVELDSFNTDKLPTARVPNQLIEKHQVLPLYLRGTKLFVGISDPSNSTSLDELKFNTGLAVSAVLVEPRKLAKVLEKLVESDAGVSLSDIANEAGLDDVEIVDEATDDEFDLNIDTPIVRFVNKILQDAIRRGASDIHIEPYERTNRIRVRIDGMLHDTVNPPMGLIHKIIARLKILSQLDIAERRLPQDGRMKLQFSKTRSVDFRVSTMPTLFGEKVVIRILDAGAANLGLDTIGMDESQLAQYVDAANQPYGMILVTGPTGSGKTVSLYSALNMLNGTERNISSAEDPVEIYVTGINQVNISEKTGLTFARVLRAFLRQDPDVLMLGEIRDIETAEIAVKASQTGHLVLSTLHTNDGPSSLTRLLNMGIAPFNIASSVNLIIAQRLVRRLCDACRQPVTYNTEVLQRAGFTPEQIESDSFQMYEPGGCNACTNGYRGRTGIFEVMPVSEAVQELVMAENCSALDIAKQTAKEGVLTIRESGLIKAATGITSLKEIERVTSD